jgi:hypothetical protein
MTEFLDGETRAAESNRLSMMKIVEPIGGDPQTDPIVCHVSPDELAGPFDNSGEHTHELYLEGNTGRGLGQIPRHTGHFSNAVSWSTGDCFL